MSKHTPGPWQLVIADGGERSIVAPNHLGALMCDTHYYPWCPDVDADWHLIAAAPEMLAALRHLIVSPDAAKSLALVEAAIAKATGGKA